jgi:2-phosphoglycerate kinase
MADKKTIILIGGAPTVGKSTMAQALSARLGLPWISTDQIRSIMRAVAHKEDYPELFNSVGFTAEEFLTRFSAEDIARMERIQSIDTWVGIKAFIEEDFTWRSGFIIEGVNILPEMVKKDFGDNENVRALFLVDEDFERTRNVVFTRGLWDDAHLYPDHLKAKEVEWVLLFSQNLKAEAQQYGYAIIDITKSETDAEAALKALDL